MKPILKYIMSPDVREDLEKFQPPEKDNFNIYVMMLVECDTIEGNEMFDFFWCTPKWLMNNIEESGLIWGRQYVIVANYNYDFLVKKIEAYFSTIEEDTWHAMTEKVSRIAHSEFEDYKP